MLKKEKGFSLIELMVVIIILAVLTGVAVPSYLVLKSRARKVATESNMNIIASVLALYGAENKIYPFTADYPDDLLTRDYIKSVPEDDSWGNALIYVSTDGLSYILESYGRDGVDGGGDDIILTEGKITEGEAYSPEITPEDKSLEEDAGQGDGSDDGNGKGKGKGKEKGKNSEKNKKK